MFAPFPLPPFFIIPLLLRLCFSCCRLYAYRSSFLFVSSSLLSVFSLFFFSHHLSLAAFVVALFFSFFCLLSCVLFVAMGCQLLSCIHLIMHFSFFFFTNTCAIVLCGFPALFCSVFPPPALLFCPPPPPFFLPPVRTVVPKTMAREVGAQWIEGAFLNSWFQSHSFVKCLLFAFSPSFASTGSWVLTPCL